MCSCNIWMPQSKTKLLFVDHVYECHPEAKDNLNFEESKEEEEEGLSEETDEEYDWYEADEHEEDCNFVFINKNR